MQNFSLEQPKEGKLTTLIREIGRLPNNVSKKEAWRAAFFKLTQGEGYDWHHQDFFDLSTILDAVGLEKESEKMGMAHNSIMRQDPEEEYEYLKKNMTSYFQDKVESGAILSREEMEKLKSASKAEIFERLFNHNTAYGLGILPKYQSPAMNDLEQDIFNAMQAYDEVADAKQLRKRLGRKLIQLKQVGKDIYTEIPREIGDTMGTGKIEYKVENATKFGTDFMPTRVVGYHGILRFYLEEMTRIAPEGANAFLDGNGILRSVTFSGMWSPIVAGNVLRPIQQPDDQYHIVPVKFYYVEVDKSRKYNAGMKPIQFDNDGKPYVWQEVVTPRGSKRQVSKSDKVLVVS